MCFNATKKIFHQMVYKTDKIINFLHWDIYLFI